MWRLDENRLRNHRRPVHRRRGQSCWPLVINAHMTITDVVNPNLDRRAFLGRSLPATEGSARSHRQPMSGVYSKITTYTSSEEVAPHAGPDARFCLAVCKGLVELFGYDPNSSCLQGPGVEKSKTPSLLSDLVRRHLHLKARRNPSSDQTSTQPVSLALICLMALLSRSNLDNLSCRASCPTTLIFSTF